MTDEITLQELFPKIANAFQSVADLRPEDLDSAAGARVAAHLGLGFVPDPEIAPGEVCLANDPEVRPEYRTMVTAHEVFAYIRAILKDPAFPTLPGQIPGSIPYPQHSEIFWQLVKIGAEKP